MSKMRLVLIFIVVVMIAFVATSCKKKPTEPDETDNYAVVKENVVDLSTMPNLSEPVVSGNTYSYPYTGSAPSIQVGDVLVGQTGYGYMRKVTGVQTQNNQIVCQTDSARVFDVISECSFNASQQLTMSGKKGRTSLEPYYLSDGVTYSKDSGVQINNKFLFVNAQTSLKIVDGSCSFDPDASFTAQASPIMHLDYLEATAGGTLTTSQTVQFSTTGGVQTPEVSVPIAVFMSPVPAGMIGPIPVFLGVQLDAVCTIDVAGVVEPVQWNAGFTSSVQVGVRYQNGQVTPVSEISGEQESSTTQQMGFPVYTQIKVGIMPRVVVLIGGVAGIQAGPQGYGKLNISYNNNTITAKLLGGVLFKYGVALKLWHITLASVSAEVNIYEHTFWTYTSSPQTVAPPIFSPPGGTYTAAQSVSLSCATSGAVIRYTTNGSEPTSTSTAYSSTISVSSTTTIKAKAFKDGWTASSTASATYTITPSGTVATPTFNPPGGTYSTAQSVSISTTTANATIRYTTNGSEPTTTSTIYNSPISVSSTTTIKAKGFRDGWTASSTASATYTISGVTPGQMVLVPGGTFTMGDTRGGGYSNELPTHSVTLNSFYMGKYEVTQAEYAQYMQPGSSWTTEYGLGDNYPAYYVSWYAILKYCNLRSMAEGLTPVYSISGSTDPTNWGSVPTSSNSTWNAAICNWSANGYRLPTEAEWEYAARGATNTPDYLYSGSDDINAVAWYSGNNSPFGSKPVGTKSPNSLGLYDMSGNVWEWCWDWYSSAYYSSSPQNNPTGPASGWGRLLRGGDWGTSASRCRVSCRIGGDPCYSDFNGFRLCRAIN